LILFTTRLARPVFWISSSGGRRTWAATNAALNVFGRPKSWRIVRFRDWSARLFRPPDRHRTNRYPPEFYQL